MGAMGEVIAGSYFCHPVPTYAAEFAARCCEVFEDAGYRRSDDPHWSAVAIAPCLTRKLSESVWRAPNWGTLIFHPSALPYLRGPDAIQWAVRERHALSGVTWFWCDEGLDTGAICSQLPVVMDPARSAREHYVELFQPAGVEALQSAIDYFRREGRWRRVPQPSHGVRYESYFPREARTEGVGVVVHPVYLRRNGRIVHQGDITVQYDRSLGSPVEQRIEKLLSDVTRMFNMDGA